MVFVSLVVLLVLFAWTMHATVPAIATVFAWGVATFALVPSLQARVMSVAGDAPNLASSINIGAFNLGNAIGAALGGGVIAAGLELRVGVDRRRRHGGRRADPGGADAQSGG